MIPDQIKDHFENKNTLKSHEKLAKTHFKQVVGILSVSLTNLFYCKKQTTLEF